MSPSYFHVIEPKGDPCANLYPLATICRTSPIWSVLILSDPASTENLPHAHCAPVFVDNSTVRQRGASGTPHAVLLRLFAVVQTPTCVDDSALVLPTLIPKYRPRPLMVETMRYSNVTTSPYGAVPCKS